MTLKNEIINWLQGFSYWLQYSGNKLLEGEKLTDDFLNKIYDLFLEDHGLKKIETKRDGINFIEENINEEKDFDQLKLLSFGNLLNVNALAKDQKIEVDSNLTIIYGPNGAGKSGFVRLLNNAFKSRGDKEILNNIFTSNNKGEPQAEFVFRTTGDPYSFSYPQDSKKLEFRQFAIFDNSSIKIHLEEENTLIFTPSGFEFFRFLISLFEKLKIKLQKSIQDYRLENDYKSFFNNKNDFNDIVSNLSGSSNIEEIKAVSDFTKDDESNLESLRIEKNNLSGLNIPDKIAKLKKTQTSLNNLISNLRSIIGLLNNDKIEYIEISIKKILALYNFSKEQGIKSLEEYKIEQIDSKEWREFIHFAREYVKKIQKKRNNDQEYPVEHDVCIFCLQTLSEKEIKLINSYWNIFKSESQAEANRTIENLRWEVKKLRAVPLLKFDGESNLYSSIKDINKDFADKLKKNISEIEELRSNIINNIINKDLELSLNKIDISVNEHNEILENIKNTIQDLENKNPTDEIIKLENKIGYLEDKKLLNKLLDNIIQYISSYKYADKLSESISNLNTKIITLKEKELYEKYITYSYIKKFEEECKLLQAPEFVSIQQRGEKGQTLRRLIVKGISANKILSEGEQRAISLADFLTEIQLDPINKGVIFDDPVNSLDHYRREKIAERFIQLAMDKQVIIFTHDISFFIILKKLAEGIENFSISFTTIRNIQNTPGIVNPELPWIAQNIKSRVGYLRNKLVSLKNAERTDSQDDYILKLKTWYGLLREAWERAVEERLFKGVIERFSLGIQTQKLKKVKITDDLLDEIGTGMTESSKWLHDTGAGLNPPPPTIEKIENDLKLLDDFQKKCIAA